MPRTSRQRRNVTLSDVAAHAGVSRSTVSLVLRGSTLIAPATRDKVLGSIKDLHYVYNRGAALLRSGRSHTVGLLVCQITEPFYAELTDGVDAALDRAGWIAFLGNSAESPARQDRFVERLREHNVDGIILCPVAGTSPALIERLRRWRLPCVQTLRSVGRDDDFVAADNRRGVALATEHLIRLGHRRIVFIGGANRTTVARDRIGGYRAAMRRHGLAVGERDIVRCASTRQAGAAAIAALLAERPAPTAAVCYNDVIALGVMIGLHDRGLRAGKDFAVVGFDDIGEAAMWRPALTTVAVEARQIGQAAAELLLRRIAAPDGKRERIILPSRLVVRESCGGQPTALTGKAAA